MRPCLVSSPTSVENENTKFVTIVIILNLPNKRSSLRKISRETKWGDVRVWDRPLRVAGKANKIVPSKPGSLHKVEVG